MLASNDPKLRLRLTTAMAMELLPERFIDLMGDVKPDADRAFLAHCFYSLYDHLSRILHRHDRIGMAASMEMRVPFLENEMFDFAFPPTASRQAPLRGRQMAGQAGCCRRLAQGHCLCQKKRISGVESILAWN